MTRVSYTLNSENNKKLVKALKESSKNLEKNINEYLYVKGSQKIVEAIISFMPISKRKKKHARDLNPLKVDKFNLGIDVYAKGGAANKKRSFGYLVFPNEGRGAHNPIAQEFFQRGLKSKEEVLFNDILKIIKENL